MALTEPVKDCDGQQKKYTKRNDGIKKKIIKQTKDNLKSKVLSKEIPVTHAFIEECKKLSQTISKTKRGGPYSKKDKKTRRDEVFKLHFEYGYSARKISDIMKINRNTINSDVSFWYSRIRLDYEKVSLDDLLNKQFFRSESQRARLRNDLDLALTVQERLPVEKMILELDSKVSVLIFKLMGSTLSAHNTSIHFINDWMEKNNFKNRYMSVEDLYSLSETVKNKIDKILKTM